MRLSALWISPLLRANSAADDEYEDGSSESASETSVLAGRAAALVGALRAAGERALTPAEERAVVVLMRALQALLGGNAEEQDTADEET